MEQIIETIKERNKNLDGKLRSKVGNILYKVICRKCRQKCRVKHSFEGSERKIKLQNGETKTTRLHLPKYCKR